MRQLHFCWECIYGINNKVGNRLASAVECQGAARFRNFCDESSSGSLGGAAGILDVMNKRVTDVRKMLLKECPAFQLIHDVADVAKHAKLAISKKTPSVQREVMNSNNVNATAGIFQAPFGESVFGEASEIMVTLKDGSSRALLPLVKTVFDAIPPFL